MADDQGSTPDERAFNAWLRRSKPGDSYRYHFGDLGSDKVSNDDLGALADRLLHVSNGRYDVVSECGHIFREEIVGEREVELVQRPDAGCRSYLAQRRRP